ncbi:MAG TPA: hypothetical protein ENN61_01130 [Bacteroidaceae bacterium]|nr:hypothetical protein [Bacteroidaceae bacterium]
MKSRVAILIILFNMVLDADVDFRGQLSLQGSIWHTDGHYDGNVAAQYIPNLHIFRERRPGNIFDIEASVFGGVYYEDSALKDDFRAYRLNARYTTRQSELQIGLQKINFGPAQLLRSLMWFEREDPMDPLNIAEGVRGLRYKYNFMNNSNIWFWGLYGNNEPKGWETFTSISDRPEFGGRVQTPVPFGEMAVTTHYRRANNGVKDFQETRIALDGRYDIFVGVWFEASVQHQDVASPYHYTEMVTLGADYTFGLGNGLYILGEHMLNRFGNEFGTAEQDARLSAIMVSYPLGLFDTLSGMLFYSWEIEDWIQYFSWQRSYDRFVLNLSLFNFPDIPIAPGTTRAAGYGLQFMLLYNH